MRQLFELFWSFFKIGLFTLGGGYAMLPLIHREVIEKRGWIDKEEFLDLAIVAQSAPGPIALNTAVFIGYKIRKFRGALSALLGIVIPSFVIILFIAILFQDFRHYPIVDAAFKGMRPAVVSLIIIPVISLARKMHWSMIGVIIAVAFAIWKLEWSPMWMLALGAIGGIVWEQRLVSLQRKQEKNQEKGKEEQR